MSTESVTFTGYCTSCKGVQTATRTSVGETKNGKVLNKGTCSQCGKTVTRIGKLPESVPESTTEAAPGVTEDLNLS